MNVIVRETVMMIIACVKIVIVKTAMIIVDAMKKKVINYLK